ncbi:MAG: hypothetical protein LUG18_09435 [Candidatus Azobacteroides sp.]|nr:hypothetical protein [Candidatus Azobacteroides sp.]
MKKLLFVILINFLNFSGSILLYNYLTMARGYIWHDIFGSPLWNYTREWYNDTLPVAIMGSAVVAMGISLLDRLVCIRYLSKHLSGVVYFICYAAGWIFIALLVSNSYIWNFGNTWKYTEIIREIVFIIPWFTIVWIGVSCGLAYFLIRKTNHLILPL